MPTDDRFDKAAALLPQELRSAAMRQAANIRQSAEEIRLRCGQPPSLVLPEGERNFSDVICDQNLMRATLDIATGSSVHTAVGTMKNGFINARGGFRIGLSGSAIMCGDECTGFQNISGMCIRISRQIPGVGIQIFNQLGGAANFPSVLIISPPGGGKTTLLRDLVRLLSLGGKRVALCDERGEIAAMRDGVAQMDVGPLTDVLEGAGRAKAMEMMLRSMNPQVLAVDEITAKGDMDALCNAVGCGVTLLATAHASKIDDLYRRPLYNALMDAGIFGAVITVRRTVSGREYSASALRGKYA